MEPDAHAALRDSCAGGRCTGARWAACPSRARDRSAASRRPARRPRLVSLGHGASRHQQHQDVRIRNTREHSAHPAPSEVVERSQTGSIIRGESKNPMRTAPRASFYSCPLPSPPGGMPMTFETLTFKSVDVRPVLVPLQAAGRLQGRPVRSVADDPDRPPHRGRHRRPQLSRAVSEAVARATSSPRSTISPRRAQGKPIAPLDDFQHGRRVAEPRRPTKASSMIAVSGPRHGGVGCAGQGRRHAARGLPRRFARRRCPPTTATACG